MNNNGEDWRKIADRHNGEIWPTMNNNGEDWRKIADRHNGEIWPDLTAHDRAWKQAVAELGAIAPLRQLIRRAHEILREAPHNAMPNDHRSHQG